MLFILSSSLPPLPFLPFAVPLSLSLLYLSNLSCSSFCPSSEAARLVSLCLFVLFRMPADFKVGESHEGERRRKRDWMERVSRSKRGRRLQCQEKWMLTLSCRGVVPVRAQKHHHQYSIYNPYLFYEEGNMLIWRHYGQSEEKCRKKHTFGFFSDYYK